MQQVKANFAKIRAAVEIEHQRLSQSSYSLWSQDKALNIRYALNRIVALINKIENHVEEPETIVAVLFPTGGLKEGDLDKRQFKKELLSSIDKILDFKLHTWVERKIITYYDAADNEKENVYPAHWKQHGSIRETLGIGRFNIFSTLFMTYYGTLWGKSTALSNVESRLATNENEQKSEVEMETLSV